MTWKIETDGGTIGETKIAIARCEAPALVRESLSHILDLLDAVHGPAAERVTVRGEGMEDGSIELSIVIHPVEKKA